MIPAPSYYSVIHSLKDAFSNRFEDEPVGHIRLIGILFAPIGAQLARSEIIPRLNDFHFRSADNIDFFFAGYGASCPAPQYVEVPNAQSDGWRYSSQAFSSFCNDLETRTRWTYKGGCELILANAKYKKKTEKASIDFKTAIVCDIDKMKADGAIESVERFFETIFQYAKGCSGEDPAWGFSDQMAIESTRSALILLVLSLLPKNFGKDVQKLHHFAVRDISPDR